MNAAAARFGAVFAALWAAHDLGDHVVQNDHQAAWKADPIDGLRPMAGHLLGYHATQVAALAALRPLGVRPSWRRTAAAVAWSVVSHGFLDRRWPVVAILDATGSRRFARPRVVVELELRSDGTDLPHATRRRTPDPDAQRITEARGPLPLHGAYLADQALHHAALFGAALILSTGRTP